MNSSAVRVRPNIIGEIGCPFLLISVAIDNAIIDIKSRSPNNSDNTVDEGKPPINKYIKDAMIIYTTINARESLETLKLVRLEIVFIKFTPSKIFMLT